jgi:glycerate 2-kinase
MSSLPFRPATDSLVNDAIRIWQSGVEAVTPKSLMQRKVQLDRNWLIIDEHCEIDLRSIGRLIIVGAGKASAAMANEFVTHVCKAVPDAIPKLSGWINAPAGSFVKSMTDVHLHAARPEGSNMPTLQAIEGTQRILELVSSATAEDVVLCMISGGGSALLVSPQPGLCLEDKLAVAQCVAAAGGNIVQLNTIRRCISQVKGGGLARACKAGRLVSLVISDVLGDPLEMIASGPTVVSGQPDCAQALQILKQLGLEQHPRLQNVKQWLARKALSPRLQQEYVGPKLENIILGNLADAVDAAGVRAVKLGYRYVMQIAREPEGDVAELARDVAANLKQLQSQTQIDCWISGGEPTVKLPDSNVGKGGRNQQLALSVLEILTGQVPETSASTELVFLSAGTDGEDGPTEAAGAWFDSNSMELATHLGLDPRDYLQRADAYHFFEKLGGLFVTGPTGTNVCDLRVALSRKKY